MKERHAVLNQVEIFSGLNEQEREMLLDGASVQQLGRKQTLFGANTPAHYLHVIISGAVKTVRRGEDGQRLLVDFYQAGEALGEESVLLAGEHDTDALPFDQVSALAIPAEQVRKVMDQQPRLGKALAALAAVRARSYRERLFAMTSASTSVRLAQTLHLLARRFGKKDKSGQLIALRVTHQDLADYIGASRETVSIFISRFRQQGLIKMNVRRIIIPDLKALKRASRQGGTN